ncbi:PREDICTED: uncharacterized protein LOC109221998 [Nicotiana attenuata]|uniref:uncharacterized protein LOC109221998 n=1 Tax=Nicotiana attenuata TaxID=49451 RepID=UPI00090593D8|nr:PREDICTED: uncharacterized protein LOC109221998 [Nicotiana attenuata]
MLDYSSVQLEKDLSYVEEPVAILDRQGAKAAFKYCNVWATHPNFIDVVKEGWEQDIVGCIMFRVVKKLKTLKQKLKVLYRRYFSNIVEVADADRIALAKAQAKLHRNQLDARLQAEELQKLQRYKRSSYMAEVFLLQRSRATWIKLGDDNNRYFFSVIKHRRLQEAIIQLVDKFGRMKSDQEEIAEIFVDYYQELLRTKGIQDTCLSKFYEEWKDTVNYSTNAIGKAIYSCKSKGCYEVTNAVLEFLDNGQRLTRINSTSIALIPKVENPLQASQFRPISCCNALYKCISKIICRRRKKAIPLIVADNQAAFIEGRSLIHNVFICHDLLGHYNMKTTPRCLMKIDLKKAYDMVRWEFREEVLKGYGIPMPFIQLIMVCVTITTFTVKVNGGGF